MEMKYLKLMTKNILIYIALFFGSVSETIAQHAYFPMKGTIMFDREVYTRARTRELMQEHSDNRNPRIVMRHEGNINEIPEKTVSQFLLQFDEDETLMQPYEQEENTTATPNRPIRSSGSRNRNIRQGINRSSQQGKIYYQNIKTQEAEIALELDEKYLLQDSLQNITWRFTDEYRNIAGYECRRVNGATPDSLYIVAFYTDQIPLSAGPVLTHGLPGMILGLAIPEMHINYWATKVDFSVENVPKQWRDKKNKILTTEQFFESLNNNRIFGGSGSDPRQRRRNLLENLIY